MSATLRLKFNAIGDSPQMRSNNNNATNNISAIYKYVVRMKISYQNYVVKYDWTYSPTYSLTWGDISNQVYNELLRFATVPSPMEVSSDPRAIDDLALARRKNRLKQSLTGCNIVGIYDATNHIIFKSNDICHFPVYHLLSPPKSVSNKQVDSSFLWKSCIDTQAVEYLPIPNKPLEEIENDENDVGLNIHNCQNQYFLLLSGPLIDLPSQILRDNIILPYLVGIEQTANQQSFPSFEINRNHSVKLGDAYNLLQTNWRMKRIILSDDFWQSVPCPKFVKLYDIKLLLTDRLSSDCYMNGGNNLCKIVWEGNGSHGTEDKMWNDYQLIHNVPKHTCYR